ncbi:MAG: hypothetical protein PHI29_05870 [Gallionella sp.]|nr:hypothetical protein [Gallionella sp.]
MKKSLLVAVVLTGLLVGCGGMAPLVAMPAIPESTEDKIAVKFDFSSSDDIEGHISQDKTQPVMRGSSVVINVPRDPNSKNKERRAQEDAVRDEKSGEYNTQDFFNSAEQEIERVFINQGFRVLSRAKLEAKLRDLRDESRCNVFEYSCLRSQVAPETQFILDDLKNKYDKGMMSIEQFQVKTTEIRENLKTSSAGKKREADNKELVDMSEVIRAAQSGPVSADYILQINSFDRDVHVKVSKDLRQLAEVREFVRKHPEIDAQLNSSPYTSCTVVAAKLNAKLIDVKSGGIIWIGDYNLNTLNAGVNNVSVELVTRTFPANAAEISRTVNFYNSESQRQARRDNKSIRIPSWQMESKLFINAINEGSCDARPSEQDITYLSRALVSKLIGTIKVSEVPAKVSEVPN